MDYENASVDEITAHFRKLSRQRISQLYLSFKNKGNEAVVAKIQQVKKILKDDRYLSKNGCTLQVTRRCRVIWDAMHDRVTREVAYADCRVEFASEKAFREWALKQVGFLKEGFELDKDILIKGNRVYGPETCVFIPREINSLFSNCYDSKKRGRYPIGVSFNKGSGTFVAQMSKDRATKDKYLGSFKTIEEAFACYKQAKEAKIRRLADKWRSQIDPRAYEALISWTVEWDD